MDLGPRDREGLANAPHLKLIIRERIISGGINAKWMLARDRGGQPSAWKITMRRDSVSDPTDLFRWIQV